MQAIKESAVLCARAAGELQRKGRENGLDIVGKGTADITTAVDYACEKMITAWIRERHPGHGLLSEEGAALDAKSSWSWLVDPLDGTKNYANGLSRCGVSLAVLKDGLVEIGVVYAPFLDELFVATRGGGATCNGVSLHVSSKSRVAEAMIASAFTFENGRVDEVQTSRLLTVFQSARALRSMGCAALDLCDVARGRFDAYFEPGLAAWDTAAGALIVEEAGGFVTTIDGSAHIPGALSVLATNSHIHAELLSVLGRPSHGVVS